jgi:predicted lipoprotein with Yx(FWY)xxD motif
MRLSIKHLLTAVVAIGLAVVFLAACGGGDGDSGSDNDNDSDLVSVQNVDGADVLADAEGKTLYTADVEEGGRILCTGACTSFWDPIAASADEASAAEADLDVDLGVVKRPGGEDQLTFDGLPLYSFTEEGPGRLEGDGFVDDFEGTTFEWTAASLEDISGRSGDSGGISPY